MKRLLLLLCLCYLSATPLHAQFISVEDIHFPAGTTYQQLKEGRMLMAYSLKPAKDQTTKLRTFLFDTLLQVHQSFQAVLPYEFRVLKVTKAGDYYAHLLQPRGSANDAVVVITDGEGNITGQQSFEGKWKGIYDRDLKATQLFGALQEPAFYLTYKRAKKQYAVAKLTHDGTLAWEYNSPMQSVRAPKLIVRDEHLYIYVQETDGVRKYQEHMVILNTDSGEKVNQFTPGTAAETIRSNRLKVSDDGDTITFLGRSYAGRKLDNHSAGLMYLAQYDKTGNLIHDLRQANHHKRIYWHDLVEANGRQYLVGETFRTTTFGEHLLMGVVTGLATMGMFAVSTGSLTTKELIIRPLDSATAEYRSILLPSTKYTIGNHNSPFMFADLYVADGAFRYRKAINGEVLLQVYDDAYTLALNDEMPQVLQATGKLAPPEYVLYYGDGYFIAYTFNKQKNIYQLQRYKIELPGHDTKSSRL